MGLNNICRARVNCPAFIPLVIIMLSIPSCIKKDIVEMRSLKQEPKLVVYGILNPLADSIKLMITSSYPLNTDNNISLDDIYVDAQVFIIDTDGQDTAELRQLKTNSNIYGIAQSEFDIQSDKEYKTRIESAGFETAVATTKIPGKVINWTNCTLIQSLVDDLDDYKEGHKIIGTWQKSGIENDQAVSIQIKDRRDNINENIERRTYTSGIYIDFSETDHAFIFESPSFFIYEPEDIDPQDSYRWYVEDINAILITTDTHLYNYLSYYLLIEDINNVLDGGSFLDLFRGITPEFSNVEGGLGVFGSCRTDTAIVYKLNK